MQLPTYTFGDLCRYVLCHVACMCRLYELHSMAKMMDPAQASCQIQLLTELHSRFPEVPVEVIKIIMDQVCSLWSMCVCVCVCVDKFIIQVLDMLLLQT